MDAPGAASQTNDTSIPKKRAACDECRVKKLKCTGEQPSCSRCLKENITCVYGAPKRMGRPKKRARSVEEEPEEGRRRSRGSGSAGVRQQSVVQQQQQQQWNGMDMEASTAAQMRVQESNSEQDQHQHLDPTIFDSAFTPGGNLQPWFQAEPMWNFDASTGGLQLPGQENMPTVPSLIDDTASEHSPPTLNLPPELQSNRHHHSHPHVHNRDMSTQLLLDPSLTPKPNQLTNQPSDPLDLNSCACLSTMYLTLSTLQSTDPTFPFPFALHPLRQAMQTASEVLVCENCPQRFITAVQNTQLLGTLLISISERFGKIVEAINLEASRAEIEGVTKKFRLADLSNSNSHLHTGGLGCAAAFNIDLSPAEWASMAKKVVRAEIWAPGEGHECCASFDGLLDGMTRRQEKWHQKPMPQDFPRDREGRPLGGPNIPREDHACLKLAAYARSMVERLEWS